MHTKERIGVKEDKREEREKEREKAQFADSMKGKMNAHHK